jgi:hypothetical protein
LLVSPTPPIVSASWKSRTREAPLRRKYFAPIGGSLGGYLSGLRSCSRLRSGQRRRPDCLAIRQGQWLYDCVEGLRLPRTKRSCRRPAKSYLASHDKLHECRDRRSLADGRAGHQAIHSTGPGVLLNPWTSSRREIATLASKKKGRRGGLHRDALCESDPSPRHRRASG